MKTGQLYKDVQNFFVEQYSEEKTKKMQNIDEQAKTLNDWYRPLEMKCMELFSALYHRIFELKSIWTAFRYQQN